MIKECRVCGIKDESELADLDYIGSGECICQDCKED